MDWLAACRCFNVNRPKPCSSTETESMAQRFNTKHCMSGGCACNVFINYVGITII